MNKLFLIACLALSFLFIPIVYAEPSGITVDIVNQQAKSIYDSMQVELDGAAGHSYKHGKSILCWKINVDMDDEKGALLPENDVKRYHCKIHFDKNGLATPHD